MKRIKSVIAVAAVVAAMTAVAGGPASAQTWCGYDYYGYYYCY